MGKIFLNPVVLVLLWLVGVYMLLFHSPNDLVRGIGLVCYPLVIGSLLLIAKCPKCGRRLSASGWKFDVTRNRCATCIDSVE